MDVRFSPCYTLLIYYSSELPSYEVIVPAMLEHGESLFPKIVRVAALEASCLRIVQAFST